MGDFLSRKKWVVSECNRDVAASIAENCGVDPFAAFLLCARGMTEEYEVDSFLFDAELIDPFTLPDMLEAVERIFRAIENKEKITIFGDYDADGVTATAILYLYLLNHKRVDVDFYIPNRLTEGYGMNKAAIDSLKEKGTQLIITVDNGISAIEEVAYAKSLGIDVVVTDHHMVGDVLPDAAAVVNPHRADSLCEFSDWAGVGVAFKLMSALDGNMGYELLEEYGDIIALGTVADIVPLKGENRVIVRSGIKIFNSAQLNNTLRYGMYELAELSAVRSGVDSSALAFRLAPKLNAAGRMDSAEKAVRLLTSINLADAGIHTSDIARDNNERYEVEAEITEAAIKYIESDLRIKYSRVIVVDGKDWHQGVIGIVASRLVERYGKPCIVVSDNEEIAKGSGRSIDGFSLYDALSYCSDVLVQFGGHTLAAGMSLESEKIPLFREKINEYARMQDMPYPVLNIDCKLNPASLSTELVPSIKLLEPFGAENPQPLFGLFNMTLTRIQPVGDGKHLRLSLERNGTSVNAIMFSVTADEFEFSQGDIVDVAVKLDTNAYQGKVQLSIQVKDIKFSNTDDEKVLSSMRDYEEFSLSEEISEELKNRISLDRELCGMVYKFIKANKSWKGSEEALTKRLGVSEDKIAGCRIALEVLRELKLIGLNGKKYYATTNNNKTSLENSRLFLKASK